MPYSVFCNNVYSEATTTDYAAATAAPTRAAFLFVIVLTDALIGARVADVVIMCILGIIESKQKRSFHETSIDIVLFNTCITITLVFPLF